MPEIAEQPASTGEMPEGLRALLETELAGPEQTAEPKGNELLPGEEPPPQKPPPSETTPPPPAEKPPVEKAAVPPAEQDPLKALRASLAPDFDAPPTDKAPIQIVEVPDMPEQPPDHIKTAKAREDYRKWRENHAGLLRQIQELQVKASAPADTELQTRYAELEKENQVYRERVERVDLWSSPAFERDKLIPREKNFEAAANIVKEAGVEPQKLRRALSLSGYERTEALDDLAERISSKTQRDRFGRIIDAIDEQTTEINQMVANARKANEEYRKQDLINRHKSGEKSVQEMKTLLAAARKSLEQEGGFWILKKSDNPEYDWYNKEIDLADRASEELLLEAGPEQAALGAALAPHAIRLFKMLNNERSARKALENEIRELREAGGDLRPRRTPTGEAAPDGLHGMVRKLMSE